MFTIGSDYPIRDIKGERVDDCSMTEKKLNYRNLLVFQAFLLYGLIPNNIFIFLKRIFNLHFFYLLKCEFFNICFLY